MHRCVFSLSLSLLILVFASPASAQDPERYPCLMDAEIAFSISDDETDAYFQIRVFNESKQEWVYEWDEGMWPPLSTDDHAGSGRPCVWWADVGDNPIGVNGRTYANLPANEVLRFEFVRVDFKGDWVPVETFVYTYYNCGEGSDTHGNVVEPEERFFCPTAGQGHGDSDAHFFYEDGEVHVVVSPWAGLMDPLKRLNTHFSGTNWIIPYNGDVLCAHVDFDCFGQENYFLASTQIFITPQALPQLTFAQEADVLLPAGREFAWTFGGPFEGTTLRFPPGRRLVVEGDLVAENATLTTSGVGPAGARAVRWGGLAVYMHGSLSLAGVTVSSAEVGLDVYSDEVSLTHTTLTGNGTGLRSSYVQNYCRGPQPCLVGNDSSFRLEGVQVSNNSGIGVLARNARDVQITNTTVRDNGSDGLYLWNAEVTDFRNNPVESNGGIGARVLHNADLSLTDMNEPVPHPAGGVRLANNGGDEVYVGPGGHFFAGKASDGGDNAIFDSNRAPGTFLIYNDTKAQVHAERTFWGLPSGPPAGALLGWINATGPLPCDPTEPGACPARPSGGPLALPMERGNGGNWLRETIWSLRQTLRSYPDMENADFLVHALYALQRLDADDRLGEHGETMALLASLRGRLARGEVPATVRTAAEAALETETYEALRTGRHEAAQALLAAYGPLAEGAETQRALALSAASLDEQAGRPAEALARLEAVRAELSPEEDRLAEALAVVAGLLAEATETAGRPGATAGMAAGVSKVATVEGMTLSAPYPNPASGAVVVPLVLEQAAEVTVVVHDVLGREVAHLGGGRHEAGEHRLALDAQRLPAGVYVVRASVAGRVLTQRLTVLR